MNRPIAEDFAGIRARMAAIRAEERPWMAPPPAAAPQGRRPAPPADFHSWLMGGTLWAVGA